MTTGTFDRKIALRLGAGIAAILILKFVVFADRQPAVVGTVESEPMALKRLEKVREVAGTVPAREALLKQAAAELDTREKGMLKADTAAQAQAQLQDTLHRIGLSNGIDIRGMEDWRVKPLGNDYGEASVSVRFSCTIEQLVNFLSALANVPELLSTNEINVTGNTDKNKVIQVRLTLAGVVSKKVAQEKRSGSAL